jgi:hypothetical protein
MDNEQLVRKWQAKIVNDCEAILGRPLDHIESTFICSRGGFIALEMIEDTVTSLAGQPAELHAYLTTDSIE